MQQANHLESHVYCFNCTVLLSAIVNIKPANDFYLFFSSIPKSSGNAKLIYWVLRIPRLSWEMMTFISLNSLHGRLKPSHRCCLSLFFSFYFANWPKWVRLLFRIEGEITLYIQLLSWLFALPRCVSCRISREVKEWSWRRWNWHLSKSSLYIITVAAHPHNSFKEAIFPTLSFLGYAWITLTNLCRDGRNHHIRATSLTVLLFFRINYSNCCCCSYSSSRGKEVWIIIIWSFAWSGFREHSEAHTPFTWFRNHSDFFWLSNRFTQLFIYQSTQRSSSNQSFDWLITCYLFTFLGLQIAKM